MSNEIAALETALKRDPENPTIRMQLQRAKARVVMITGAEAVPSLTYDVLAVNFTSLGKTVKSLASRAKRAGATPLSLRENKREWIKRGDGHVQIVNVTIIGDAPDTAGWEFCAQLNHKQRDGDGKPITVIRRSPNSTMSDADLEPYRLKGPWCDDCDVTRNRHDTFVLRHRTLTDDKTGERQIFQVGRSCLKKFLGGVNPSAALYYFDKTSELADELRLAAEPLQGVTVEYGLTVRAVLLATVANATTDSVWAWDRAQREVISYRVAQDEARDYVNPYSPAVRERVAAILEAGNRELAAKIETGELSEAEHNIAVILASGRVARRHADLVTKLVAWFELQEKNAKFKRPLHDRALEMLARHDVVAALTPQTKRVVIDVEDLLKLIANPNGTRNEARALLAGPGSLDTPAPHGRFLGQRDERGTWPRLVCTRSRTFNGRNGLSTVVCFEDSNGRKGTYFADGNLTSTFRRGRSYRVTATISQLKRGRHGSETHLRELEADEVN